MLSFAKIKVRLSPAGERETMLEKMKGGYLKRVNDEEEQMEEEIPSDGTRMRPGAGISTSPTTSLEGEIAQLVMPQTSLGENTPTREKLCRTSPRGEPVRNQIITARRDRRTHKRAQTDKARFRHIEQPV